MRKLYILIIILIFAFSCAKKEEKIEFGIVTIYIGSVKIEKEGKSVAPEIKMILRSGDKVVTEKDSRIDMQVGQLGIIRINQESTVAMSRMLKEANENIKLLLKEGEVICKLEKLKRSQQFNVETPTAVVGVRGTTFLVDASEKEKKTSVAVEKGTVEVVNKKEKEKVVVKEQQSAEVSHLSKVPKVLDKIDVQKLKKLQEVKKLKLLKNIRKMDKKEIEKLMPNKIGKLEKTKVKEVMKQFKKNVTKERLNELRNTKKNIKDMKEKVKKEASKKEVEKIVKNKEVRDKKTIDAKTAKEKINKAKNKLKGFLKR